jgi:hypothetical protein
LKDGGAATRVETLLWTVGFATIQNGVFRKNLKSFDNDYCKLRVITQSPVDTPNNVLLYSNLQSESELSQINERNPEQSVVCLSQPVVADREPFRELLRKLT